MSSEASVERCSVCGQDWHAAANLETVRALSQATIASLTTEKDAAERRVVELEGENTGLKSSSGWVCPKMCEAAQYGGSCRCSDLSNELPAVTRERDEALTALSQERTARVEAERERDDALVSGYALAAAKLSSANATIGVMGKNLERANAALDALRVDAHLDGDTIADLTLALEESRTARQAAEALVGRLTEEDIDYHEEGAFCHWCRVEETETPAFAESSRLWNEWLEEHGWSDRYDRPAGEVRALFDSILALPGCPPMPDHANSCEVLHRDDCLMLQARAALESVHLLHELPAALTPTAPEQRKETPMNITIYINRNAFTVTKPFLSGTELRYLPTPAVAEDYDLWEVIPGESNDVKITSAAVVEMRDRQQFFTSPSHINEG